MRIKDSVTCKIAVATLNLLVTQLVLAEDYGSSKPRACATEFRVPARPVIDEVLEIDEIHLTADEADLIQNGVSTLKGRAEITQNQQQVRADLIRYNEPADNADLDGNVEFWDTGVYLNSDAAHLELDEGLGQFNNADYRLVDSRGRGFAEEMELDFGVRSEFKNVDYTTCDPEDNFWKLKADKIKLDHVKQRGTARNVVLKIKDIPVFYSPYMSFPLSDARKSGFLAPGIGNTNRHGFEFRAPYYWNIAPNMDATITPRLLTDSGLMLMGEYRYLFSRGAGSVDLEYLPSDSRFNDNHRNLFRFLHNQRFAQTGTLEIDYNRVSDKEYFEDFGQNLSLTSTRFLAQRAEINYRGSWWRLNTLVQNYQTVDRSIAPESRPFRRLPQIRFATEFVEKNQQFNFGLESELTYFERSSATQALNDSIGARVDLYPHVTFPVRKLYGYVVPKLGVKYTQYSLSNTANFNNDPSRVLPIASIDSGLFFERDTRLFSKDYIQTLEPRLYYLYIPPDDQDDLPVFDSGVYDFTFNSLFRENRFSGQDRINDTSQVTLAVTTRFINQKTGQEKGYLSVGQIYYMQDRDITLPNQRRLDSDLSPIAAEARTELIPDWDLMGQYQWNPDTNVTEKLITQLQYDPGDGKLLNLAYRTRNDNRVIRSNNLNDIEQTDVSFRYPFNPKWSIVGRWNYALSKNRSIELFGGLEYEDCCWGMRLIGRRFITDFTGDTQTGIFLQLQLKGLSGVGKKAVNFLENNIPNYSPDF